ncbi:MAG: hypothetical protein KAS48_06305, partial [Gammaproteobacteria bacterium]|nr:hypothetical protein [Gammaproteobacteria bacterium]
AKELTPEKPAGLPVATLYFLHQKSLWFISSYNITTYMPEMVHSIHFGELRSCSKLVNIHDLPVKPTYLD